MLKRLALAVVCTTLTACSTTNEVHITSYYDYQLFSPDAKIIAPSTLPLELLNADVILVGEWHTHAGVHRFQTDLLNHLSSHNPSVALSMEQFSRDKQPILNQYLNGDIGEQVLIKQGNAWPNYESDYRPLVELAKTKSLDVIAANAPKPIVRCIGQQGISYLDKISNQQRTFLAENIALSDSPYKEKFMASMHHGQPDQTQKQYAAQVTWDETMADSIVSYLAQNPKAQVLHTAGKFHIEQGLGIKASIQKRNSELNVVVITPTGKVVEKTSDYQLHVLRPPERYIQMKNRMAAYQDLAGRNSKLECIE